jgi:pimeloyl-ACP methyl ester carboxylesterase
MAPSTQPEAEVPVSEELFAPVPGGVELCYQTFGDPDDPAVLLVMGLGGPMTWWDPDFCRQLAARGCYVIRYDNRDTGRSSRIRARVGRTALVRAFAGRSVHPPYTLTDMAGDAVGLLDHLGLDAAHVVGVSMGGMIAQATAIAHPTRVRSLTSIMSTTGKRTVGWQHPRLLPMLIAPRGAGRDAYAAGSAKMWRLIGSPGYPQTDEEVLARALETFDRGVSASGVMRQMLAILAEPDRGPRLRSLSLPALVIHGSADKMVHVSGGRTTARAVPGAELLVVDGMGHDLPRDLFTTFVDAITRTIQRAS